MVAEACNLSIQKACTGKSHSKIQNWNENGWDCNCVEKSMFSMWGLYLIPSVGRGGVNVIPLPLRIGDYQYLRKNLYQNI